MEENRRGKRKSPCTDFFSEINDLDLSPENSNSDTIERESKMLKVDNGKNNADETANLIKTTVISLDSSQEDSMSEFVDLTTNLSSNSVNNGSMCVDIPDTELEIDLTRQDSDDVIEIINSPKIVVSDMISDLTSKVAHEVCEAMSPEMENKITSEVTTENDIQSVTVDDKSKVNEDSDKAIITVQFQSKETADLYKSKFLRFLDSFAEFEIRNSNDELTLKVQRDPTLNMSEWVIVSQCDTEELQEVSSGATEIKQTVDQTRAKKKKKKSKAKKELFVVDTKPNEDATGQTNLKYSSKFVIDSVEKSDKQNNMKCSSVQSCFNCDKNHSLKDCPEPKNYDKIRAARQKFNSNQQQKTGRYHLEEDQKFHHIKPGNISDNLRKALGLHEDELPPYIYSMRVIGYPPGWLEEAKIFHSNLNMFDIDGNNVRDSLKKKKGLNSDKIVNYPGFNVPVAKGYRDEYKRYRVPPYSDDFNKEIMIKVYEQQFAKEQDDLETCDMEVDDEHERLEQARLENNEINDSKYNVLPAHLKKGHRDSPSLKELEEQKKELLAELQDSTNSNPKTEPLDAENKTSRNALTVQIPLTSNDSESSCLSPGINNSLNIVKETNFGTPILKSSSPYSRLPNPENFMKDVSPVINFENLPNSTGKYEQMNGVIQKVRDKMKHIQKCST